jgi:hypothetical protein
MSFYPRNTERSERVPEFQVYLRPRSLLVFAGDVYEQYMHEIAPAFDDTVGTLCECANAEIIGVVPGEVLPREDVRVSLTIRCVR